MTVAALRLGSAQPDDTDQRHEKRLYELFALPTLSVVREGPKGGYGSAGLGVETAAPAKTPRPQKVWMTIEQVANYLNISRASAYRLRMRVRSSRALGIGLRFLQADIDDYLLRERV